MHRVHFRPDLRIKDLEISIGSANEYRTVCDLCFVTFTDFELRLRLRSIFLAVLVKDPASIVDNITNAGAIFIGEYSTEPVGDYSCGSNHILPTCGTARFSPGLSVQDFVRGYSVISYPKAALHKNADYIKELANTEGMRAHALAVEVRNLY